MQEERFIFDRTDISSPDTGWRQVKLRADFIVFAAPRQCTCCSVCSRCSFPLIMRPDPYSSLRLILNCHFRKEAFYSADTRLDPPVVCMVCSTLSFSLLALLTVRKMHSLMWSFEHLFHQPDWGFHEERSQVFFFFLLTLLSPVCSTLCWA